MLLFGSIMELNFCTLVVSHFESSFTAERCGGRYKNDEIKAFAAYENER